MRITVRKTKNVLEKMRGLIAASEPEGILIQTRFGIHTFGLRFPIDLAVIDREDYVRTLRHEFKPNGIFLWSPKYDRILELPKGTLKENKIKKGEKLELLITG